MVLVTALNVLNVCRKIKAMVISSRRGKKTVEGVEWWNRVGGDYTFCR